MGAWAVCGLAVLLVSFVAGKLERELELELEALGLCIDGGIGTSCSGKMRSPLVSWR